MYASRRTTNESQIEYQHRLNNTFGPQTLNIPFVALLNDYDIKLNYAVYNSDSKKLNINFLQYVLLNSKKCASPIFPIETISYLSNNYKKYYLSGGQKEDVPNFMIIPFYIAESKCLKSFFPENEKPIYIDVPDTRELRDLSWEITYQYNMQTNADSIESLLKPSYAYYHDPIMLPVTIQSIKVKKSNKEIYSFDLSKIFEM